MTDNRNLLELTAAEKQDLERWAQSRTLPAGDVFRARLILALADGQSYREMVRGMRTSAATIARWRRRFEQDRLAGLEGRHRGSKPRTATPAVQNHDQIANTGPGERVRLQTSPARYRAVTALLLLGPWTPLLFQGEEFGASSPFMFFADIGDASVRDAIRKGRAEWLAPFLS